MRLFIIVGCIISVITFSGCGEKKPKPSGAFVSTQCKMVCNNTQCDQVCTQVRGTLK